ncbi:segregation/condensation protein A [Candidatus Nanohalobium constans]|uniref:Segregation and condensation protein A n=1 Tax=Candidatus Nanohalobium constans TaxID=2565781 RepID=A0A5Q0UER2_9ARCH|nr:segregation/condensation protein A [Candidatus Nanohalobium constans]QGA80072.1 segregation and condensation protein A [Candidatus Nanohalobium constans]
MDQVKVEEIAEEPWEETIDFLTADMPPQEIDITVLADRYRQYLSELQEYDLSVPAKAIRICAALLKMKTQALEFEQAEEEDQELEEDPMAFEDEEMMQEELMEENTERIEIKDGPDLEVPVKQKPKRRMRLDELKGALEDAVEVKQRRDERRERRAEMDQEFEMDEEDLTQKLNQLLGSIKDKITTESDEEINFDDLIEQKDREEKIEKFKHMLHLENDEKVRLIQEEFLGDLKVQPQELEENPEQETDYIAN